MGIPLRSASTMSLPEGASCEGVRLGHPSGPGLSPQIGLGPHTGPPSSDWVSPLVWASPHAGPHLHSGPPPSDWVLHLRMDPTVSLGLLPQIEPPLSDWSPPSFWAPSLMLGLSSQTGPSFSD